MEPGEKELKPSTSQDRMSANRKKKKKVSTDIIQKDFQYTDILKAIDVFDVDKSGKMPTKDLKVAVKACGFEFKKEELQSVTFELDPESSGQILLEDFAAFIAKKLRGKDPKEEILRAYKYFDKENKGGITFADLKKCAEEVGETLDDDELQEMLDEADLNNDGIVDQEEFSKIMSKTFYSK